MEALAALVWLGAALLIYAGSRKLAVPDGVMAALHRLRLPSGRVAGRLVGVGEIVVGLAVLLVGGSVAAAAVLVTYVTLLAVAVRQRAAQEACGCFGGVAELVGIPHLATNAVVASAALAAIAWPPPPYPTVGVFGMAVAALLLGTGVAAVRLLQTRTAA